MRHRKERMAADGRHAVIPEIDTFLSMPKYALTAAVERRLGRANGSFSPTRLETGLAANSSCRTIRAI